MADRLLGLKESVIIDKLVSGPTLPYCRCGSMAILPPPDRRAVRFEATGIEASKSLRSRKKAPRSVLWGGASFCSWTEASEGVPVSSRLAGDALGSASSAKTAEVRRTRRPDKSEDPTPRETRRPSRNSGTGRPRAAVGASRRPRQGLPRPCHARCVAGMPSRSLPNLTFGCRRRRTLRPVDLIGLVACRALARLFAGEERAHTGVAPVTRRGLPLSLSTLGMRRSPLYFAARRFRPSGLGSRPAFLRPFFLRVTHLSLCFVLKSSTFVRDSFLFTLAREQLKELPPGKTLPATLGSQ